MIGRRSLQIVTAILSMLFLAVPSTPFIAFTVLEVIGAPIFIMWQARVARETTRPTVNSYAKKREVS